MRAECRQVFPYYKIRGDRKEVDLVGKAVGSLDGGDIRIDEDSGDPLFLHGLESL